MFTRAMSSSGVIYFIVQTVPFPIIRVSFLLHGPSMLTDRQICLVVYNQSSFMGFEETSSFVGQLNISLFSSFH